MLLKRSLALSGAALILGFVAGFTINHDDPHAAQETSSAATDAPKEPVESTTPNDLATATFERITSDNEEMPVQVAAITPPPGNEISESSPTPSEPVASLPLPIEPVFQTVTVKSGDTLGKILNRAGVPGRDAHLAVTALRDVFDPRDLKVGQDLTLTFQPKGDTVDVKAPGLFAGLAIEPDYKTVIHVSRSSDDIFGALSS